MDGFCSGIFRRLLRGQSLVEIALILPVMLILFLGIAEVGLFVWSHVQVINASREGARYASLCKLHDVCQDLDNQVGEVVRAEVPDASKTSVLVSYTDLKTGSPLTVTVSYSHTAPFVSIFIPMFPEQLPIEHRTVMLIQK